MPLVAFTCEPCKCLFGLYMRDGDQWAASCPKCGDHVENGIGPHGEGMRTSHLRLPNDQYDYISAIDGSHISSKRAHRDHLKRHGVIELGNEKPPMKPLTPRIPRESIHRELKDQVERMKSHGQWREG